MGDEQSRPNQSDATSDHQGSHDREPGEPGTLADRESSRPAQQGKTGGDAQNARHDRNAEQGTGGREGQRVTADNG